MSLLEKLQEKRHNLKATKTIITQADGTKFIVHENGIKQKLIIKDDDKQKSFGFVIDTKPDNCPACIIDNQLYLGSQDCVDEQNIIDLRLTHILSIGIDTPPTISSSAIITKFIPCLDLSETDIKPVVTESISFISNALEINSSSSSNSSNIKQAENKVLVHCNAGVSRSATVVIAYLMIEKKFTFSVAMQHVKSKRECIQPNAGFIRQLKQLDCLLQSKMKQKSELT